MNSKTRHWTFIVYPDSAPQGWTNYLEETGIPFCVSPLHDLDLDPDGLLKKPHYHVMISFDGPTTYKNVVESFCEPLHSPIPKKVMSVRGMYRYFAHMDNPEKHQYNILDIKCYNGFYVDPTESEITAMKSIIIDDINKHDIQRYSDLVDFYQSSGDLDYFRVVSEKTFFFSNYIKGRNNSIDKD